MGMTDIENARKAWKVPILRIGTGLDIPIGDPIGRHDRHQGQRRVHRAAALLRSGRQGDRRKEPRLIGPVGSGGLRRPSAKTA